MLPTGEAALWRAGEFRKGFIWTGDRAISHTFVICTRCPTIKLASNIIIVNRAGVEVLLEREEEQELKSRRKRD